MIDYRVLGRAALLGCIAATFLGCAETLRELPSAAQLDSQARQVEQEYRIGPRDVLQINVWRQPELSAPEVVVRLDGKISLPLVDDVNASGLTPIELKEILRERLSEYVSAPHVTVIVRQINSKLIYMLGEVAREGPIAFRSSMRVLDALSLAGGFGQFADTDRVKVIRERNGAGPVEFVFDYDEFVSGESLEQNILLLPGDRIVVPAQSSFGF